MGRLAGADSTRVFAEPCVQHIEAAVFDMPASAKAFEQVRRVGFGAGQTGDGIRYRLADLPAFGGLPLQTDQLLHPRPIEIAVVDEVGRRGDRADFKSTAILLGRAGRLLLLLRFPHSKGGKSFVGSRRLARHLAEVAAGSI